MVPDEIPSLSLSTVCPQGTISYSGTSAISKSTGKSYLPASNFQLPIIISSYLGYPRIAAGNFGTLTLGGQPIMRRFDPHEIWQMNGNIQVSSIFPRRILSSHKDNQLRVTPEE